MRPLSDALVELVGDARAAGIADAESVVVQTVFGLLERGRITAFESFRPPPGRLAGPDLAAARSRWVNGPATSVASAAGFRAIDVSDQLGVTLAEAAEIEVVTTINRAQFRIMPHVWSAARAWPTAEDGYAPPGRPAPPIYDMATNAIAATVVAKRLGFGIAAYGRLILSVPGGIRRVDRSPDLRPRFIPRLWSGVVVEGNAFRERTAPLRAGESVRLAPWRGTIGLPPAGGEPPAEPLDAEVVAAAFGGLDALLARRAALPPWADALRLDDPLLFDHLLALLAAEVDRGADHARQAAIVARLKGAIPGVTNRQIERAWRAAVAIEPFTGLWKRGRPVGVISAGARRGKQGGARE